MKAVILESYVMHPGDLDWSGVKALVPDTTQYVRTAYEEIVPRIQDAELVLLNKCRIDEATGRCEGCLRTLDEIVRWRDMDSVARQAVWAAIRLRAADGPLR
mgnify:CR=1 FL=1